MKTATLAKRLFLASRKAMWKQKPTIGFGQWIERWEHLPAGTMEIWLAVAEEAKASIKTEK